MRQHNLECYRPDIEVHKVKEIRFGILRPEEITGMSVVKVSERRVWDSSAEIRYLVLPERPAGTEGLGEDELAALVTRDSMIGVARVSAE